ncbi:3-dehydroquinate dehydratase type I AroD [Methanobrevibacter ruminantium M1]|uniref:3-dehydroquinate dehydratase n=1 Tax=Methanobrevibacter ruminantium (strain ATCC 35063 / DSM 1093 / JCM 13430 / OCM 146 / M1) TaxID=634498 RepID=D3E329_METRM|nr:type I 3-dehydroquinate dehydratase [Methanobrevibacter ruminantium]ADC46940.1 3-dehydroquinate dehydratase type I AroD [Methanobrevibacter ruminantium M1]
MYSETKIAIPIFQKKKEDVISVAQDCIIKGADILELRIDGMENPNPKLVREIIEEINFPIIATNRTTREGGFFKGTDKDRIAILRECADVADFVDVELQTNRKLIESITETGVKTIISYHNFKQTPDLDFLIDIVNQEKELGDIAKIAVMPNNLEDTLTVLAILSHFDDTVAISMGELGSYTRVIASKFNAPFTFAVANDTTAPGQIDIDTMRVLLNSDLINTDEFENNE